MKKIVITLVALALVIGGVLVYTSITPKSSNTKMSTAIDNLTASSCMIKSAMVGSDVSFSREDFKVTLGIDKVDDITITSVPDESEGVLKIGDVRINAGDTVQKENIDSLVFSVANEAVRESGFGFSMGSYAGGAALTCKIRVLESENHAPSASATPISVSTHDSISIFGSMTSSDPENDEVEYFIVSFPEKGKLELTSKYGDFKYTPNEKYTGKDSFSYIVRDCYGNYSDISTVSIKIEENTLGLEYLDMKDCSAYNASLALAEKGIMLGELSGDGMYFRPDAAVSRADFLVMVMKAAKISNIDGLTQTSFDDNDKIPDNIRPYVATAQRLGYVRGSFDGDGLYFRPSDAITRAEAAVIIANMLKLPTQTAKTYSFTDSADIPSWAENSVYAVYENGIFRRISPTEQTIGAKDNMTRAQAAEVVYSILGIEKTAN